MSAIEIIHVATFVLALWLPGAMTAWKLGRFDALESAIVGLAIGLLGLPVLAFGLAWLLHANFSLWLIWIAGGGWLLLLILGTRLRRPRVEQQ
ncbi:MAG: hypothetical protein P9M14_04595 [Candidatus Alcyoniella australis]|nr:hypothetical protein [Candidatus Alcyoniella australis]